MTWRERLSSMSGRVRELRNELRSVAARTGSDPRLRRIVGRTLALVVIGFILWNGFARVNEGQVGVLVNNLTGSLMVKERVGYHFYVPWIMVLYRLDRRVQSLVMGEIGSEGSRGGDALKIKTSDGSNVSIDTLVTYRLIPERAGEVLRSAGLGVAYGELWVRSAVRAMGWREFGKITTEQMYDATLRNERAQAMIESLNKELTERGIEVVAVTPQDFRFYKEYEEVIKKKKLADQEVEEQRAKARLAGEEQKKKVAEADYAGKAKIAIAQGEAERVRKEADGYAQRVRLEGETQLATMEKQAQALEATGLAEAEGLRQAAQALSGGGGVSLVALEYAKQLQKINFTGVPVLQDGRMGQYRITQAPSDGSVPAAAAAVAQSNPPGSGK